jgi:hypothetical protein
MQQIPRPDVLDANRADVDADPGEREQVERALELLRRGCDYGAALWQELDRVRQYLSDIAGEGVKPPLLRGGHDWQRWARVFAEVTSALAGPGGDNGYGLSEARLIAQRHGMQVLSG